MQNVSPTNWTLLLGIVARVCTLAVALAPGLAAADPCDAIRKVRQMARESRLDESTLDALDRKNSCSPPVDRDACVDWAYAIYHQSLSSDEARDQARNACVTVKDLDVAKLLYDWFHRTLMGAEAVTQATSLATSRLAGKKDILEFAWARYLGPLGSEGATNRTATKSKTVPRGTAPCLEREYKAYYGPLSGAEAMDKAFANCQGN